jgi:RHS repeat-associated protein
MRSNRLRLVIGFGFLVLFICCGRADGQAPSITSISPTSGPVGTLVTIAGSNFGATQGTSTIALNGTTATLVSWASTSIAALVPSGASSGSFSVAVNGTPATSSSFTVTPLPSGWSDGDVGSVGVAGSAAFASGTFTVKGAGSQIYGTADGFNFMYQSLSGDGTIVARVVSLSGGNSYAASGVMIRETLTAGSTNAKTAYWPAYHSIYFDVRTTTGGSTSEPGTKSATLPYWVEVVRSGTSFTSYTSPDGVIWSQLAPSQTISMAQNVYIGLAVTSANTSALATATFDNVSVNSTAVPAPVISGVSPDAGVIGSQVTITGSGFGSSQGSGLVNLNGNLVTVNSWSNTSIAITIPSGATSGNLVVSVAPGMNDSNPFTFLIGTQLLGTWMDVDVGSVGMAGSASYANGTFTVKGSGAGISQAADGLNFLSQSLSGDGTIVARIVSVQGSGAQVGVMIRETLAPSSTLGCTCYSSYMYFYYRASTGSNVTYQGNNSIPSLPYWVKLARTSSMFTAYLSPDGINWTQLESSETITMAQNVNIGLVVTSDSNSSLATATFDNVSISTTSSPAPVIAGLSTTTGPVGTEVVISGSGFGSSQGNSTVTLSSALTTVGYWSSTSIVITIASGMTSGPLLVSVAPGMNDSNYAIFNVTTQPLPSTWLDQDVGAVGKTGSATYANGIYTIQGSGTGVGGTADQVHFAYQPLSGDGTIIARVISVQNSSTQAGVMIRETLNSGAREAFELYSNYMYFYYRTSTGGSATYNGNMSIPGLPYWMKLVRSGSTFAAYVSANGLYWTQLESSETISMAQNVYIGLAVSSDNNSSLATATFDNVSISSAASPAPAITSVSATSGAIGSQVAISGSGFGASINTSLVLLNDMQMTIDSWSATSIIATIPSGATSGMLVVAVAPTMNDSNPAGFTVTSQPLPVPWLDQDIGAVNVAGSASYASGTFTVKGSGTGIQGTADGMHFVYQPLSGDGSIVARVASVQGSSAQAGVMVRETLNPNATDGYVFYDSYMYFYYRTTTGGNTSYSGNSVGSPPYWVRLVRTGNTFTAYVSPDGVSWTQRDSAQTNTMAQNVYIGFAVSSNVNSSLATATFDNATVTIGTTPFVTGVSPDLGGIGSSVTISGSNFGATQGSSTLSFNGTTASSITGWGNTQIVANVPIGATTGPVNVVVNSIQGISSASFDVIHPVVTSVTPPSAPIGGTITVTGTGFGTYTGFGQVLFNGTGVSGYPWSDTSITATVPSGSTSGPLTVVYDGVASNSLSFTVLEPLSVTAISPTAGSVGSTVTITGTGFGANQSDSAVTLNGTAASVITWTDTGITAVVPTGASTGPVTVDVATTTADGPSFEVTSAIQLTDSLGNQSSYSSVMVGGKWYVSSAQGSGCSSCTVRGTVQYQYDHYGNVLSKTDELGHITSYTYDSNQNLLSVSQQANSGYATTSYTYNSFGEPLTVTDPLGNVTTNTYDTHGNLLTVTTPAPNSNTAGSVTQFVYNSLGEMTQITDPRGRLTKIAYTSVGLISTITDAQNNITTYAYDTEGDRTSVTDAMNNQTTFAYDSGSRLLTITYPGNVTTTFTYDYRGRRTSVTDQNGKKTTYAYDDADRLTSVTDPNNHLTTYTYDTENNLRSIEDANNNTTSFGYDAYGRVIQTTFPSTHYEQYGYDAANNLTSKTDRNGQTIGYVYDDLSRMTQKNYPNSTNVEYVYDLVGKLQQVTDPTGTYGFAYDNMGRLVGTTTQYTFVTGTYTNAYTYDANSNRASMTDPQGGVTSYAYDTLNRLSTLTPPSAFTSGSFGFAYDALNRRTQMTRPNGVTTNYTYNNLSQLLSVLHQVGTSTIDGATYTVDPAGNRTAKTDNYANVTSSYTYDPLYELTQVTQATNTTESYSYDPVGNRVSSLGVSPYSVNTSNELTSTPSATYTYDNNGNTLTKVTSAGTTTYSWDFENRLTSVTLPGTGGTLAFKYDGVGRRVQKVFTQGSTTTTTNYLYDGINAVADVDQNGNALARYAETQQVDEPLAELRSGTSSYYSQDGLGSITSLTTSAGALGNAYRYDSFGNVTASSGSIANRFQYTAREFDSETSLYYYRARYSDPQSGRFISEDPMEFAGGINFYPYALNTPVNLRDPSGKNPGAIAIPIAGGACFATGVCETIVGVGVGVLALAATGYVLYNWYENRGTGNVDPIPYPGTPNPGACKKEPGKCNPCPPDSPYWDQPGDAHGSTGGVHYHWWHWNQKPYPDCTCYPSRMDGGSPPPGGTPWIPGGPTWP